MYQPPCVLYSINKKKTLRHRKMKEKIQHFLNKNTCVQYGIYASIMWHLPRCLVPSSSMSSLCPTVQPYQITYSSLEVSGSCFLPFPAFAQVPEIPSPFHLLAFHWSSHCPELTTLNDSVPTSSVLSPCSIAWFQLIAVSFCFTIFRAHKLLLFHV